MRSAFRALCALTALSVVGLRAGVLDAQTRISAPGLERPVEILTDRWGISHIYAETEHDLFFAQGYNAARGGDASTPNATGNGDNQTAGASFRIIVDTGDWDRAVGTNTPGQSGNPESPHYRDLFAMWANNRYFPVAYSRERVERVTEANLLLQPEAGTRK